MHFELQMFRESKKDDFLSAAFWFWSPLEKKNLIVLFTCWHLTWKSNTCGHLPPCCSLPCWNLWEVCVHNTSWLGPDVSVRNTWNYHSAVMIYSYAITTWLQKSQDDHIDENLSLCTCLLFGCFFFGFFFSRKGRILLVNSFHIQLIAEIAESWRLFIKV